MDTPPAEVQQARAALRVVVTDEDGLPIPGVLVELEGQIPRQGVTDIDGVIKFDALDPIAGEITLSRQGFVDERWQVRLEPGRTLILRVTLRPRAPCCVDPMEPPPLLPDGAAGGTARDEDRLGALPVRGLGGLAGLAVHPALGLDADERGPYRLEGLALPEAALVALPLLAVGGFDARGPGLGRAEGTDLSLAWFYEKDEVSGGVTAPLGGEARGRGWIVDASLRGLVAAEAGLPGSAVGVGLQGYPSYRLPVQAAVFSSPELLFGTTHLAWYPNADLGLGLGALGVDGPDGASGRAMLEGRWFAGGRGEHTIHGRAELLGSSEGASMHLSAGDLWEGYLGGGSLLVAPAVRARVGGADVPLEAGLSAGLELPRWAAWARLDQRWEGLEALEGPAARTREAALGGGWHRYGDELMLLEGRLAGRRDLAGETLPGRAELRLRGALKRWWSDGLASLTWRPPIAGFNSDLPELEGGLLLGVPWHEGDRWVLSPGLGLRGAVAEELSGGAALRLAQRYEGDRWSAELAVELSSEAAAPAPVWGSLRITRAER